MQPLRLVELSVLPARPTLPSGGNKPPPVADLLLLSDSLDGCSVRLPDSEQRAAEALLVIFPISFAQVSRATLATRQGLPLGIGGVQHPQKRAILALDRRAGELLVLVRLMLRRVQVVVDAEVNVDIAARVLGQGR